MSAAGTTATRSRARAALHGLALGDALGMPTQSLSRARIHEVYGELSWFQSALPDHPLAAGMTAGSVTDDTEQALVLADVLIDGGGTVDPADLARRLLDWQAAMRARGSLDLLGPSSNRAFEALLAGEPPTTTGRFGTTNGAAMRIAPVGVAFRADDLPAFVDRVVQASSVSHDTGVALAGAAAVAAAVSAGLDGATVAEAIRVGRQAAEIGGARGHWVAAADVSARIGWAVDLVSGARPADAAETIYTLVGTSLATQESVPAAFAALAVHPEDPWAAMLLAASVGGDCDTIAAMAGAMAGACHGMAALPEEAVSVVRTVNDLRLDPVVDRLLEIRAGRRDSVGAA